VGSGGDNGSAKSTSASRVVQTETKKKRAFYGKSSSVLPPKRWRIWQRKSN